MQSICSRCQLPTEAEHVIGGKCVDCFAAESVAAISGTGETFASMVAGLTSASWDDTPLHSTPVADLWQADAEGETMSGFGKVEFARPSLTADQRDRLLRGEWIVQPDPQVVGMTLTSLDAVINKGVSSWADHADKTPNEELSAGAKEVTVEVEGYL